MVIYHGLILVLIMVENVFQFKEEFDSTWEYAFSDKIHLFVVNEIDDKPIFEVIRQMSDYISGCPIIATAEKWEILWKLLRNAMLALNKCGLMDDDQTILLMVYRAKPDLFDIHQSEWFMPLKEFGGEHLTLKQKKKNSPLKKLLILIYGAYLRGKRNFKYIRKTYKYICSIKR